MATEYREIKVAVAVVISFGRHRISVDLVIQGASPGCFSARGEYRNGASGLKTDTSTSVVLKTTLGGDRETRSVLVRLRDSPPEFPLGMKQEANRPDLHGRRESAADPSSAT